MAYCVTFEIKTNIAFLLQILMHNTELTQWEFIIYVWFIFHWLAMSHCCYNPLIYCYMNARFRIGFLQILYFVPGIRRCCCINAYTRDRSTSLRTGIALTGKFISNHVVFFVPSSFWLHILHILHTKLTIQLKTITILSIKLC